MSFTLEPEFWFRHDHVHFEQLVRLADGDLDSTTLEIIEVHTTVCETCREDINSFLAFRKRCAREMEVSYGPTAHAPTQDGISWFPSRRSFGWKPAYAIATVVLVAVAILIVAMVLQRRSQLLEAKKNEPPQINALPSPTPTSGLARLPSPSALPTSPSPASISSPTVMDHSAAVAVLKDSRGEVTVDENGRVTGLDEIPSLSRQEIAQAVLLERMGTPEVLKSLAGQESNLRGSNNGGQSFRLLYPAASVIIDDKPVFKWESLAGTSGYRVYVLDLKGNEVARSEELSPTQTQWTPKTSLKRGEIFSWVVTGVVEGKEIVSPAASAPEMKFAVLSTKDAQELNQLKRARSHLALGVFYARVGLLREAEREFQQLVQLNPESQLPRKLLRSVRPKRDSK
jgi:hypothetical protein